MRRLCEEQHQHGEQDRVATHLLKEDNGTLQHRVQLTAIVGEVRSEVVVVIVSMASLPHQSNQSHKWVGFNMRSHQVFQQSISQCRFELRKAHIVVIEDVPMVILQFNERATTSAAQQLQVV